MLIFGGLLVSSEFIGCGPEGLFEGLCALPDWDLLVSLSVVCSRFWGLKRYNFADV